MFNMEKDWDFATNSDFLLPISLFPNALDLKCFQTMNSVKSNDLLKVYNIGCEDTFEFVKTFTSKALSTHTWYFENLPFHPE